MRYFSFNKEKRVERATLMASELFRQSSSAATETTASMRPQDSLLCNMDLPLRDVFYPLGYAVEIITNELAVLEAARDSFRQWGSCGANTTLQVRIGVSHQGGSKCPPEPTRREYNHLYSMVADVHNQALLDLRTCSCFVWVTRAVVDLRLYFRYNFLEKTVYLLLGASLVTDLHAACVSRNGKGILLCGDSGAGKSTLAYACARTGWTYTSDDTTYLINDSLVPRVIGHSHRARFRPSAKALFPELEGRELTPRLEGKPSIEVPISELPVASTAAEATVHAVVYLVRHFSVAGRLVPLPEGAATQRLRAELYSAGEIRAKHEKILEVFSGVPAYELHYCDPDQAVYQLELLTQSVSN
jgi:hypothetical protein